jgi:hypothetical protein
MELTLENAKKVFIDIPCCRATSKREQKKLFLEPKRDRCPDIVDKITNRGINML